MKKILLILVIFFTICAKADEVHEEIQVLNYSLNCARDSDYINKFEVECMNEFNVTIGELFEIDKDTLVDLIRCSTAKYNKQVCDNPKLTKEIEVNNKEKKRKLDKILEEYMH
tara:strand:- start:362 stop:700 length:339 start_codon:yes stop_codon:yes gene_type:complete